MSLQRKTNIEILSTSGYCQGVDRAINIALRAKIENPSKQILVLGMLVHNKTVINKLKEQGIITIDTRNLTNDNLEKILPMESIVVLPAHGHIKEYDKILEKKHAKIYDAICPKVMMNLKIIEEETKKGRHVIYIGNKDHPETKAALSLNKLVILYDTELLKNNQINTNEEITVINQTTLNYLDLKKIHERIKQRFPNANILNEICGATRIRQEAIANSSKSIDLIVIVGDRSSSNTKRLYEIARVSHPNVDVIYVESKEEIDLSILSDKKYILIASGASTPKETIKDVYDFLSVNLN